MISDFLFIINPRSLFVNMQFQILHGLHGFSPDFPIFHKCDFPRISLRFSPDFSQIFPRFSPDFPQAINPRTYPHTTNIPVVFTTGTLLHKTYPLYAKLPGHLSAPYAGLPEIRMLPLPELALTLQALFP